MRNMIFQPLRQGLILDQRPWKIWNKRARTSSKILSDHVNHKDDLMEVDFSKISPKKYLLSWSTIIGGVEPEKNGYYIRPAHSKWVNENGNSWLNQVLLETYRSFIWAENYVEHIQVPEFSRGKILDAVAWVVQEKEPGRKTPLPTIFIDILVATNKKFVELVNKIKSGKLNSMSMGCFITHSQCSQCGEVFEEDIDDPCSHIKNDLGGYFTGKDGRKHRVSELCGLPGKPDSNVFNEGSWVGSPAFEHALTHGFLKIGDTSSGRILKAKVPKHRIKDAAMEN